MANTRQIFSAKLENCSNPRLFAFLLRCIVLEVQGRSRNGCSSSEHNCILTGVFWTAVPYVHWPLAQRSRGPKVRWAEVGRIRAPLSPSFHFLAMNQSR